MSKTYKRKLSDPRWQKRRLEVLEYANWRCQLCGNGKEELHCHHSYYAKGKQPWQYPQGAIIALCATCHEKQHPESKPKPESQQVIEEVPPMDPEKAAASFMEIFRRLAESK